MLALRPACALARFSFVVSTRAKAQHNIKRSGPFLRRDLAPYYSAIDTFCGGEREVEARIAANVDLSEYDLVDCRLCEGHGPYDGSDCPACGGEEQMPNYASEQMDWAQFDMVDCPRCDGSGQGDYGDCQVCNGESKVSRRFRDQYE